MSLLDRVQQKEGETSRPVRIPSVGGSRIGSMQTPHIALRGRVQKRLVEEFTGSSGGRDSDTSDTELITTRVSAILAEEAVDMQLILTRGERQKLIEQLVHDMIGLGPLEELIQDDSITEIMINGPDQIYIEKSGKIEESPIKFESNDHLMQVIDRIVTSIGRRVDESQPMCDARLKDGSRVNVIIPPLSLIGPVVTIRKFSKDPFQIEDLVGFGSITEDMATFLKACVLGRLNIVVSGGTGSGKTTFLNVLSSFIPEEERIITVEDAAELQLRQEHVLSLETRPTNVEGKGRISIRDLVNNALRMRPDRIVVGECRGGEALDMLQAMNTGHDGSLTTIHANSPHDMLSRLETLVLMAGTELPSRAIREQIGSAINIIVQQVHLPGSQGGVRKISSIMEVLGFHEDHFELNEVFHFEQAGVDRTGKAFGYLGATGNQPKCLEHLAAEGQNLPETLFQKQMEPLE